jgi:hypothetical protein
MYIVFKALFQRWHDVTLFAGRLISGTTLVVSPYLELFVKNWLLQGATQPSEVTAKIHHLFSVGG